MDRLVSMLHAQGTLQKALGYDISTMTQKERVAYIRDNLFAAHGELTEVAQEIGWKPWATSNHINEEAAFGECRDVLQHLMNAMMAIMPHYPALMLASHLEAALYEKHEVNYRRLHEGYDGVSNKCPGCRRAYDDVAVACLPGTEDVASYCALRGSAAASNRHGS